MARLDRQLAFERTRIARAIGDEELTGEAERLSVGQLAKLVEGLLEPLVEDVSFPTRSCDIHHRMSRTTRTKSSHPKFGGDRHSLSDVRPYDMVVRSDMDFAG